MNRYWISWWGGDNEDYRPIYTEKPPEFPWWCSGERDGDPPFSICAVIDAANEKAAFVLAKKFWIEAELRFVNLVEPGWMPESSRFPPKAKQCS